MDPLDTQVVRSNTKNGTTTTIDPQKADEILSQPPDSPTAHPSTFALHADDPLNLVTDVAPPLHLSTTFRYPHQPEDLAPLHSNPQDHDRKKHVYSRYTTPNTTRLEAILASLLHGPCLTYSSGLSALYALLVFLKPRAVSIGDGYHGCHGTLALYSRLTGCRKLPLDCAPSELGEGDLICLETPVNPTGLAFNIESYAEMAHNRGAYLLVDATFGPPPLQDPFKHGADVVMHSGTKYIGGHSDMLCGILAVKKKEWLPKMVEDRLFLGSVMGSMEGWLGVRSVRTLGIRVERQSHSTERIVRHLHGCIQSDNESVNEIGSKIMEKVKSVLNMVTHASLQKEDMSWLRKQMPNGFGPVFSILMRTESQARRLPSKLKYFHHATSLGGVESLIEWRTMSDATVDKRLLRVSVGLEDSMDLLMDLVMGMVSIYDEDVGVNGTEEVKNGQG
ncbi:MAG: hypothetical protein Q9227_000161 [Pyrenula ochraceoflavens]